MKIKILDAKIDGFKNLSKTAREIAITTREELGFIEGAFVNIFMDIDGENIRRAYSISSTSENQKQFTVSVRHLLNGKMSPLFWKDNVIGRDLKIMGPLGINTINKITKTKVFLFAFGIGVSVIKPIAETLSKKNDLEKIVIICSHKTEEEILYKDFFDKLQQNPKIEIKYTISRQTANDIVSKDKTILTGHMEDHISEYKFDDSCVYICGQDDACKSVSEKINKTHPINCDFMIEGFH